MPTHKILLSFLRKYMMTRFIMIVRKALSLLRGLCHSTGYAGLFRQRQTFFHSWLMLSR
ncbi:hypothetical protein FOPG_20053 [Fusarium oxysporum f. sp. conglutinans race 2 54008]|uniref:Uncharacterized protein n=1 Tax=Fusarium oxysporum f. sp. conglutinans race 2 54008 TaxID=1089457 RepID=X0HR22_FUSOX|nr:hypothetical protein FOPG_20053 [Fusarium oxysporum f. sp. conglutinans race 2 54008]